MKRLTYRKQLELHEGIARRHVNDVLLLLYRLETGREEGPTQRPDSRYQRGSADRSQRCCTEMCVRRERRISPPPPPGVARDLRDVPAKTIM